MTKERAYAQSSQVKSGVCDLSLVCVNLFEQSCAIFERTNTRCANRSMFVRACILFHGFQAFVSGYRHRHPRYRLLARCCG